MPRDDYSEWTDEELDNAVRGLVTPQLVEWANRHDAMVPNANSARTSAHFNHLAGCHFGVQLVAAHLDRLLTEANNPEYA